MKFNIHLLNLNMFSGRYGIYHICNFLMDQNDLKLKCSFVDFRVGVYWGNYAEKNYRRKYK